MTEQEILALVRKLSEADGRCQRYRGSSSMAHAKLWGEAMADFNAIVEALVAAGHEMAPEEVRPPPSAA